MTTRLVLAASATGLAGLLAGCAFYGAITFSKDDRSGIERPQIVSLYVVGQNEARLSAIREKTSFQKAVSDCVPAPLPPSSRRGPGFAFAPLLIPIATFAVSQAIGAITGAIESRIKKIESKSSATYASRNLVTGGPDVFRRGTCLMLVRADQKYNRRDILTFSDANLSRIGLVLLARLRRVSVNAFQFELLYVRVNNSLAITASDKPVSLAIAFAAKAAVPGKGGPEITVFAKETVQVPKVDFGRDVSPLPDAAGIMPMPPTGADAIEVSVGITEMGTALPNAERAIAELKALEKAIGPAIESELKKALTKLLPQK